MPSRCRCSLASRAMRRQRTMPGAVDRLVAQEHVLGHRQRRDDRQLLVHHADAGGQRVARRAEPHRPAVEPHLAVVVVHARRR